MPITLLLIFLFNDRCIKSETLFEDPKFPKGDIWGGKYDPDIIWKRAKHLSPQTPWFYFEDGASRFHVNQGKRLIYVREQMSGPEIS